MKAHARTAAALVALAMPATALTVPATALASHPPSAKQIRAAVQAAQHSKLLWATVNVCNTKHHPHTIGIRGQMPSLSFTTTLSMTVQVDYWNGNKFVADPKAKSRIELGDPVNRVVQGGANFKFHPPVILSGTVNFEWKLGRKVVGRATKHTAHGYKGVRGGDPPGYSAATCRMG